MGKMNKTLTSQAARSSDAVDVAHDLIRDDRRSTWIAALAKRPNRISRWKEKNDDADDRIKAPTPE